MILNFFLKCKHISLGSDEQISLRLLGSNLTGKFSCWGWDKKGHGLAMMVSQLWDYRIAVFKLDNGEQPIANAESRFQDEHSHSVLSF